MKNSNEDYVTNKELEKRLSNINVTSSRGFLYYGGKAFSTLADLISRLSMFGIIASTTIYGVMSFAYSPYDAGKVIYAELSGNKNLKHRHVETAKAIYARKLLTPELDDKDMKNLFIELGVVEAESKNPVEDDISWYNLLDWIEDNK